MAEPIHGGNSVIRLHRRNLTVMPTYATSKCKLNQHVTTEVTFQPEPVVGWPATLTGNYFDYLGVDRTANAEQAKAAYKKLSVLLHPDKNPIYVHKATSLFKQVKEAYETLKDDWARNMYLQNLRMQEMRRQQKARNDAWTGCSMWRR